MMLGWCYDLGGHTRESLFSNASFHGAQASVFASITDDNNSLVLFSSLCPQARPGRHGHDRMTSGCLQMLQNPYTQHAWMQPVASTTCIICVIPRNKLSSQHRCARGLLKNVLCNVLFEILYSILII